MSDPSKAVVLYRGRRNSNAENIPPPSRPSSPFDQPHRSRGSRPHTLHLQYITPPFVFEYFSNPNVTVFIAARGKGEFIDFKKVYNCSKISY